MQLYRYGQNIKRLDDRYELKKHLGSGGMADVWLAWDGRDEQRVAVKVVKPEVLDQKSLNRFMKEASQLVTWHHPHILRVYSGLKLELLNPSQGSIVPYIVTEYAEGGDLKARLKDKRGQPYPFEETLRLFAELCSAVQYAHDRDIIHRDLKPANILFRRLPDGSEQAVLSDFGLAVEVDESYPSLPNAGTPAYMAPEQGEGHAQRASDIYALGVILYQLCTGWLPMQKDGELPSELHPGLPKQLDKVILTALRKDPTKRFASASIFSEALQAAVAASEHDTLFSPVNVRNSTLPLPPITLSSTSNVSVFPVSNPPVTPDPTVQTDPQPIILSTKPENGGVIAAPNTIDLGAASTGSALGVPPLPPPVSGDGAKTTVSSPTHRNAAPRWLITAAIVILTLLVVFGGIAYAAPSILGNLTNILPGSVSLSLSATVTITPVSKTIKNGYVITAVTGTPSASQRQVQASILTYTTPAQSRTAKATGIKETVGIRASGSLTFYNGSTSPFSVAAGTVFATGSGIQLVNDTAANIPAANLAAGTLGSVTVPAHAANIGASGNVSAGAISAICCASGGFISVKNLTAFSGGQDQQNYTFVQQSDIDGIVNPLEQQLTTTAQNNVKGQKKAGEQYINTSNAVQCTPHATTTQQAGDKASSVTATVTVTCSGEVYDQQAAETMAVTLYKNDSTINPGAGFALSGNVTANLTKATLVDSNKGTISLLVEAQGTWVYQITSTQEKAWIQHIRGMSKQDAQNYLQGQTGVSAVTFQPSAGNTLPTDPNQISFVINGPGSSNPISGSSSVPGGRPTATSTSVNGLGSP